MKAEDAAEKALRKFLAPKKRLTKTEKLRERILKKLAEKKVKAGELTATIEGKRL